jgi:hypothetical protein
MRQIATAPTNLPSVNATKNIVTFDYDNYRKTAPANIVPGIEKYQISSIAPATQKQNVKLAMLMKLLNRYGSSTETDTAISMSNENQALLAQQFDKNWNEIMGLIG